MRSRYHSIAIIAALFSVGSVSEAQVNSPSFGANRRKKLESYINRADKLIQPAIDKRKRRVERNKELLSRTNYGAF